MESTTRKYKTVVSDGFSLSSEFNISIEAKEKAYKKLINKEFRGQKKIRFEKAVKIRRVSEIEKGHILYRGAMNSTLNLKLISNPEKYENVRDKIIFDIIDNRITPEFLMWYFNHNQIIEYIQCFAYGAIITHIPNEAFYRLEIPIPTSRETYNVNEIELKGNNFPLRELINEYYTQYLHNFKEGHYTTAAILAGSISETFLHSYLLDIGISEKSLQNRTLGATIPFAEAYILGKGIENFPLTHFYDVMKLRNSAVHPNLAKDRVIGENQIGIGDFACFNHIVKFFGL